MPPLQCLSSYNALAHFSGPPTLHFPMFIPSFGDLPPVLPFMWNHRPCAVVLPSPGVPGDEELPHLPSPTPACLSKFRFCFPVFDQVPGDLWLPRLAELPLLGALSMPTPSQSQLSSPCSLNLVIHSPTSLIACESFEGNAISIELSIPRACHIMGNQKSHGALNQRF